MISFIPSLPIPLPPLFALTALALSPRILWLLRGPRADFRTSNTTLTSEALANRVVWITGASSGIGLSIARAAAARGALLILTSRTLSTLQAAAETLPCPSSHITFLPADLSIASPTDLRALATAATRAFAADGGPSRLDYLYNNAGRSTRVLAADFCAESLAEQMALNFAAPVTLALAVLPALRESEVGTIVNTSSLASVVCTPLRAPYCASKAAVSRFFECVRLEMLCVENERERVRVVDVCPGSVKTRIAHNSMGAGVGEVYGKADKNIEAGLDSDFVGERMVAVAVAGVEKVWLAKGKEMLAVYLAWYLPALWSRIGPRLLKKNFVKMMEGRD